MSVVKGKLSADLTAPGVAELVRHLNRDGALCIELVDNDGNVVTSAGVCAGSCSKQCATMRSRLASEVLNTHGPCCGSCEGGGRIEALPVMHSAAQFGAVLVCEVPAGLRVPAPGNGIQTTTGIDPLLNSLSLLVAQSSFYELEVRSLTSDLSLRYEELALMYEIGERIPIRAPKTNHQILSKSNSPRAPRLRGEINVIYTGKSAVYRSSYSHSRIRSRYFSSSSFSFWIFR